MSKTGDTKSVNIPWLSQTGGDTSSSMPDTTPLSNTEELKQKIEYEVRKYFFLTGYNDYVAEQVKVPVDRILAIFTTYADNLATERALEARIDELESIDYGCEDSIENNATLDIALTNLTSSIDGKSLRDRIKTLKANRNTQKGEK